MLTSSREYKMKTRTVVGREKEGLLCDPGSLLGGSASSTRMIKMGWEKNI